MPTNIMAFIFYYQKTGIVLATCVCVCLPTFASHDSWVFAEKSMTKFPGIAVWIFYTVSSPFSNAAL